MYTVGTAATVFLDIKGRVDLDKEIAKAKAKLEKANETKEKQAKIVAEMEAEGGEKVSGAVREGEREKLKVAEAEARNWEMSMRQFAALKLE